MGKVKRLSKYNITLSMIDKGDIKIFKKEDLNFNGLISRTVGLNLSGVPYIEQIMKDVSDDEYIIFVKEHYRNIN